MAFELFELTDDLREYLPGRFIQLSACGSRCDYR